MGGDYEPVKRRTLPIAWTCLVRTHEHATEQEGADCIAAVEGFLSGRRTPGPATAKMLEYINVTLLGVYKHRGCIAVQIPAELLRALDAELSANSNAPACEDRGGEER
jgi:hypothetical protein